MNPKSRIRPRRALTLLLSLIAAMASQADSYPDMVQRLAAKAPDLSRQVLDHALQATQCAVASGLESPRRLAIIDFSLPSDKERLWVFDLQDGSLLLQELVAHGKNSGDRLSTAFSNQLGSHQSSIGLFQANESYIGKHGYSLRLDGLEPGINDKARDRAIVIHGASYVNSNWIENHGRIGRSHGCPAVRQEVVKEVVDNLKGGQLLFTWYPDQQWLASSSYINCPHKTAAVASTQSPGDDS